MPDIASSILGLRGWTALAVVFALPALESSAFVGFIFPGEIAVVLGGVLAFQHHVSLAAVIAAAVSGAIIGDTIGYAVGRRWGNRLLEGPLSRFIRAEHADRAKRYLAKRGGRAVFLGRFTAALRVMVPGLAGMSGVPYARFAISNVLGGTVWAVSFVLLGYAAGASWRKVTKAASNAGLLLLGVVVVLVIVVGVARWVARHPASVRMCLAWIGRLPGVRWVGRRFERQLAWLARRMRPSEALGLSLTLAFVTALLLATGFALLTTSAGGAGTQRHVDQPVLNWLVAHRSPGFTSAMHVVTASASAIVVIPLVLGTWVALLVIPGAGSRRRRLRPAMLLATASAGAAGLAAVTTRLVARLPPPVFARLVATHRGSFPSGHATQAMALYGCAAALTAAAPTRWGAKVAAWAVALVWIGAVGFSRLYLGGQWLTDVLGGYALGALWLTSTLITTRAAAEVRARGRTSAPAEATGDSDGEGEPDDLLTPADRPPTASLRR